MFLIEKIGIKMLLSKINVQPTRIVMAQPTRMVTMQPLGLYL
jgi:hypothetical protein